MVKQHIGHVTNYISAALDFPVALLSH